MNVKILEPTKSLFEGEADLLVAPAIDGEIGIMDMHQNAMLSLKSGNVRVKTQNEEKTFKVESGFLIVDDNEVSVLL